MEPRGLPLAFHRDLKAFSQDHSRNFLERPKTEKTERPPDPLEGTPLGSLWDPKGLPMGFHRDLKAFSQDSSTEIPREAKNGENGEKKEAAQEAKEKVGDKSDKVLSENRKMNLPNRNPPPQTDLTECCTPLGVRVPGVVCRVQNRKSKNSARDLTRVIFRIFLYIGGRVPAGARSRQKAEDWVVLEISSNGGSVAPGCVSLAVYQQGWSAPDCTLCNQKNQAGLWSPALGV